MLVQHRPHSPGTHHVCSHGRRWGPQWTACLVDTPLLHFPNSLQEAGVQNKNVDVRPASLSSTTMKEHAGDRLFALTTLGLLAQVPRSGELKAASFPRWEAQVKAQGGSGGPSRWEAGAAPGSAEMPWVEGARGVGALCHPGSQGSQARGIGHGRPSAHLSASISWEGAPDG